MPGSTWSYCSTLTLCLIHQSRMLCLRHYLSHIPRKHLSHCAHKIFTRTWYSFSRALTSNGYRWKTTGRWSLLLAASFLIIRPVRSNDRQEGMGDISFKWGLCWRISKYQAEGNDRCFKDTFKDIPKASSLSTPFPIHPQDHVECILSSVHQRWVQWPRCAMGCTSWKRQPWFPEESKSLDGWNATNTLWLPLLKIRSPDVKLSVISSSPLIHREFLFPGSSFLSRSLSTPHPSFMEYLTLVTLVTQPSVIWKDAPGWVLSTLWPPAEDHTHLLS